MPPLYVVGAFLIVAIGTVGPAYALARRVGPVVPFAFIVAYVLAVGASTFIMFVSRIPIDIGAPMFGRVLVRRWLAFEWPILAVLFTPSAISALLACWFSCPLMPRDAVALLGMFLFLILVAIGAGWAAGPLEPFWFLVGELAILSTIFFAMALWKRSACEQHES